MPEKSLPKKVLDAWAILALLQGEEPAASEMARWFGDPEICNLPGEFSVERLYRG